MSEYKPNLDDEIDWKIIDQLHSATSRFSSASIELKKMYFILMGILIPSIIKLSGDSLDFSLFITTYLLTLTFWYLDAFTYFHQENLRAKMDEKFEDIKNRNLKPEKITSNKPNSEIEEGNETEEFTLDNDRNKDSRWKRSFTNSSVRMYPAFIILISIAFWLFLTGKIG